MQHRIRSVAAVIVALAALAPAAHAQEKATELTAGVFGAGYTTCEDCDGVLELATGGGSGSLLASGSGSAFAAGFYLSPGAAIEPTLSFRRISVDDDALTVLGLGIAVPFYFDKNWGRSGTYLAPQFGYDRLSVDDESVSQFSLGLAFGIKAALNDKAAFRTQFSFDYGFEGDDVRSTKAFGLFFGLSVFVD